MNIVLIGMRGSGKTTVGKILAKKLGKRFVEMDELIVQRAKLTIPEIVKKFGWEKFRELEERTTKEVALFNNAVIATGGGVVLKENNIKELKKRGKVIWLKVSVNTLLRRIGDDQNRPSLTGRKSRREDMNFTLAERKPFYRKAADFVIDTENKSTEKVAEEIITFLQKGGLND